MFCFRKWHIYIGIRSNVASFVFFAGVFAVSVDSFGENMADQARAEVVTKALPKDKQVDMLQKSMMALATDRYEAH